LPRKEKKGDKKERENGFPPSHQEGGEKKGKKKGKKCVEKEGGIFLS